MTEEQLREAMLADAKEVRKRAKDRDGTNIYLKQNLASNYHMGGRDAKPETKEIIALAQKGIDRESICKRMNFKGYTRRQTLEVLNRHSEKIPNLKH